MSAAEPTYFTYPTPHGPLAVGVRGGQVSDVAFGEGPLPGARRATTLSNRAATELLEYLAGKRRAFDVPCAAQGTPFQRAVWREVAAIPYGESRTAAEVAAAIGHAGSHRAVGAALRKCPLFPLVPTHRVVGSSGAPWGTGSEARLRGALLKLERSQRAADENDDAQREGGPARP